MSLYLRGRPRSGTALALLAARSRSSRRAQRADGRRQVPGGWIRIHLEVADVASEVERLRAAGVTYRTHEIVTGPGGAQIVIDDPSGNPIELFQPGR